MKTFLIYCRDKQVHSVDAANLRKALRNFGGDPDQILAAVDTMCLPVEKENDRPFLAVLVRNSHYTPPPLP